ncbi:helix-turn-helix domain-containing protein [Cryptosporangium phraense]|uniref:Transcriptional regulator n=1 Tax=Cryptosporangium phraense TaxID=2593070 RepID=A0A545B069_9ACTN|nr:helix-turn-helix transcriptional regulator [Cryptosporangium phraense]TQS46959.1 transcriptional regulator [Cryptosporangium phraense]
MDEVSPTLARRMLLSTLQRLHKADGRSTDLIGAEVGVDGSTVARWLAGGKRKLRAHEIRGLCEVYGVDEDTKNQLVRLAQDAGSRNVTQRLSWFATYQFGMFLDLERDAHRVVTFESTVVPGLLQTEGYAREVILAGAPAAELNEADVQERVQLRMERQKVLRRDRPAELLAILDEAVIRRPIADADAMRAQLAHLLEMAERPNVTIQVIPFSAGPHAAAATGPFVLLSFDHLGEVPGEIAYGENPANALYMETKEETDRYRSVADHLLSQALSPEASAEMIAGAMKEPVTPEEERDDPSKP